MLSKIIGNRIFCDSFSYIYYISNFIKKSIKLEKNTGLNHEFLKKSLLIIETRWLADLILLKI